MTKYEVIGFAVLLAVLSIPVGISAFRLWRANRRLEQTRRAVFRAAAEMLEDYHAGRPIKPLRDYGELP